MSDKDAGRPRSAIPARQPAPPPTPLPGKASGTERFQRALSSQRRRTAEPDTTPAPAAAAKTGASTTTPTDRTHPAAVHEVVGATGAEPDTGTGEQAHGDAPAPHPDRAPTLPAPVAVASPQGWEQPLADIIATLCRHSDPAFENWTVVVPIDPRVLPETELHLTLSRHRLSLRFQTQSAYSHRVLLDHRALLHTLLAEAVPTSREIDIEIT